MADNPFSRQNGGDLPPESVDPQITQQQIADFIHQHRDELSRFIHRKLGSEEMSSDILQDAYVRLSSRQPVEAIDNPRAFIFRIVANLVIDYQRLSVNRLSQDVDDDTLLAMPENLPGPDKRCEHQQRLDAIEKAMAELPDTCRKVFYLNRVEGYSYSEVASRLNISESMVAKHLIRAMQHCRDRLRHY